MRIAPVRPLSLLIAGLLPVAASGQTPRPPRPIVTAVTQAGDAGARIVEVVVLDPAAPLPVRIPAELIRNDVHQPVTLVREPDDAAAAAGATGYARARYRLTLPRDATGARMATLALEPGSAAGYAFAVDGAASAPASPARTLAAPVAVAATADAPAAKPETGNAFLGNLSSYGPIYGVYGPGTNAEARIQIGFKYQLFGAAGAVGGDSPWVNGLHFGYTQRLFWDLGAESSPFRNVEYRPELFYLVPAMPVSDRIVLGGQAGIRHESNGRDGLESRSINTVYVQPQATTQIGDMVLTLGPRAWFYVGSLEDNPDIRRYRGNTGLFAEIGETDGWRLSTTTNVAFQSGRASIDAILSYPIDRIVATDLNLYLFGQGFAGYGENLLDYRKKQTRLRIGIGFVR